MNIYLNLARTILVCFNSQMIMYLRVVALCCFFSYTTASIASAVKKCKNDDSKCLKEFTQNLIPEFAVGDPALGIDHIEPVFVKVINASSLNLKLVLNDVTVKGLNDCVVKKAKRDLNKNKFFVKLMCSVEMDGQYTMDGRLLIIPINGFGKNHVTLEKAVFGIENDIIEKVLEDGKKHWIINNWTYNYELKEKSKIIFENLFNGNDVLGKAAESVIEQNSNDIVQEVGGPIIKEIIGKVVDVMRQFYKVIPIDDLVEY